MGEITINGRPITFEEESNVLEVIRKAGIELPTFCYHSELSVYGGCRMCVVDIDGMGVVGACSTAPRDGMMVRTHTRELRDIRKLAVELLLADHDRECTTCEKSGGCQLQRLATQLGVHEIRFGERDMSMPVDDSNAAILRNPNKCILCGDCVRMCEEVQEVGALGFINRGSNAMVVPAFEKEMGDVECVNCGQCMAVCPTGALVVKSETDRAFEALADENKTVIVQIAPAVRVAIGEAFGLPAGDNLLGKLVAALKILGVDKVFDTSLAADLTVIEETQEFLQRRQAGESAPMFTSCCPAWVKFAEYRHPEMLSNLSSCRSPQQMFGSMIKRYYADMIEANPNDLYVISIMPCTAKKAEAQRPEFVHNEVTDVDLVLTTQEVAAMLKEVGLDLGRLEVQALDSPFGFGTGAGVMFGNSGGVSEAVLRHVADHLAGEEKPVVDYPQVRGDQGIKPIRISVGDNTIRLAVVHGLKQAHQMIERIKTGEITVDLVEVMACPGGCTGGAGQPQPERRDTKSQRAHGLYISEKMTQLRKSRENPILQTLYDNWLGEPASPTAHDALHTTYQSRRRILGEEIALEPGEQLEVQVCVGTFCYLQGSYDVLSQLLSELESEGLGEAVNVRGTFCFEQCQGGPSVMIGDEIQARVTLERVPEMMETIRDHLSGTPKRLD